MQCIILKNFLSDPVVQLKASKFSIKNGFSDLLNETKDFKYQDTVKVLLKKYKLNREIEFRPFILIKNKNNNKPQV